MVASLALRQNVKLLIPSLWNILDEKVKQKFGIKYSRFIANHDQQKEKLSREFLETVAGLSYIPDEIRGAEIQIAIENLLSAHRGVDNFYIEPPFAKQLQRLVGEEGKVPEAINEEYVLCLVNVFLTNGNGVCWEADPIYTSLLEKLDSQQSLIAILSFNNLDIASCLQLSLCKDKFKDLMTMMKKKVSIEAVKDLIDDIERYKGRLDYIKDDSGIKRKVKALEKMGLLNQ